MDNNSSNIFNKWHKFIMHGKCYIVDPINLNFYSKRMDDNKDIFDDPTMDFFENEIKKHKHDYNTKYENPHFMQHQLYLQLSTRCNMACKYCSHNELKAAPKVMGLETAKDVINRFVSQYDPDHLFLVDLTTTSEVFLYPDLMPLLKYINELNKEKKLKIKPILITNGTVYSQEYMDLIKDEKDVISFSFDGPPEIHDKNRPLLNGKRSSHIILNNLKKYFKYKNAISGVNATYTPDCLHFIERLEYLYSLGFRKIVIAPARGDQDVHTEEEVKKVKDEYAKLADFLLDKILKEDNYDYFYSILNKWNWLGKYLLRVALKERVIQACDAGYNSYYVTTEGKVYPCRPFADSNSSLLNESYLNDISEEHKSAFREMKADSLNICKDCWGRYYCGGECFYQYMKDNSNKPDERICEIKLFLIELSIYFWDRLIENGKDIKSIMQKHLSEWEAISMK